MELSKITGKKMGQLPYEQIKKDSKQAWRMAPWIQKDKKRGSSIDKNSNRPYPNHS